jgi:molecular chaperone GrpE
LNLDKTMTNALEDKADTPVVNTTDKSGSAQGSAAAHPTETAGEASAASVPPSDAASGRSMTGEQATPRLAGEAPASPSDADPAELKDRLLRVLAEQENFRRRIERERDEAIRFAATQLVKDLLQTADNLARALESVPPDLPARSQEMQNLLAGVAASERALQDTFARHGITQIQPALGEPFDPHQHQAMFEVEAADREPGTIAQIVLPGYAYHERLLRPAFVAIAKPDADRPD